MSKVSIITVVQNNFKTISHAIESVLSQDYKNIEHIIIDGGSTDGTVEIIKSFNGNIAKFISEPDQGMPDAMNKGLKLAEGSIIGILHSDDFYASNTTISEVVSELEKGKSDMLFGDLVFVNSGQLDKVVRYYDSAKCTPDSFAWGWMPAHPTCFIKKSVYEKYGDFKTDYRIAADYEILTRFMAKYKVPYTYIPKVMVKMRIGGMSTSSFQNNWLNCRESVRACTENGISTNIVKILSKYFTKVLSLFYMK